MTRCFFYIKNASRYRIQVVGTRGSDWGDIVNSDRPPGESGFTVVQSMGCPNASGESNHWGWLYLKAFPENDHSFTKYFVVFVRLRHSGDCMEMGFDSPPMRDDGEQPDWLPERNMPSNGTYVAEKNCSPAGTLKWYPDKEDQDWRLRNGEKGAPVLEITFYG